MPKRKRGAAAAAAAAATNSKKHEECFVRNLEGVMNKMKIVKSGEKDDDSPLQLFEATVKMKENVYINLPHVVQALLKAEPESVFHHRITEDGKSIRIKYLGHELFRNVQRKRNASVRNAKIRAAFSTSNNNNVRQLSVTNLDRFLLKTETALFDALQCEANEILQIINGKDEGVEERKRINWDKLGFNLGGMGLKGLQLYLKSRFSYTGPHDEIAWSTAYNYMRRQHSEPNAKAIWIGYWMRDLVEAYNGDVVAVRHAMDPTFSQKYDVIAMLQDWQTRGLKMWVAPQSPGMTVVSPSDIRGAAHLVITFGSAQHIAWNHSSSPAAFQACLAFDQQKNEPVFYNSGLATRVSLPCKRLQHLLPHLFPKIEDQKEEACEFQDFQTVDSCQACYQILDLSTQCSFCVRAKL